MNAQDIIISLAKELHLKPRRVGRPPIRSRLLRFKKGNMGYSFVCGPQDVIIRVYKIKLESGSRTLMKDWLKVDLHDPDSLDKIRAFI